jgi:RNA ligase
MEKLDGSMVHPGYSGGNLVLMTRKGYTDVAQQAMDECAEKFERMLPMLESMMSSRLTPIFEFVSPRNRIVISYPKADLIPIAVRDNYTGKYIQIPAEIERRHIYWPVLDLLSLPETIKAMEGREGAVIAWPNGHRVKIKADEYVLLHRNIDLMGSEKRVMEVVLENKVDDLIPMLDLARSEQLIKYQDTVMESIENMVELLNHHLGDKMVWSQKDYAIWVNENIDSRLRPIAFNIRKSFALSSISPMGVVIEHLKKTLRSNSAIDDWRDLLGGVQLHIQPLEE